MSTDKKLPKLFHSENLQRAVEQSIPWFNLWDDFKNSVIADIESFEHLLNIKKIPITAWVAVGDNGFLGWAPYEKSEMMMLLFKKDEASKPTRLLAADLETKVLVFPYVSELSYLLCTRIKLAHTSQALMDRYVLNVLGEPKGKSVSELENISPLKIAKYI